MEALKAEEIIAEELVAYEEWFNALAVVPTIVSLREKMEAIMKGELERSASWMKTLDGEERSRIEILTASIVNKILHDPIVALKEESRGRDELPYVAAVRRLFKI